MNEIIDSSCDGKSFMIARIRRLIERDFSSKRFTGTVTLADAYPKELIDDDQWEQTRQALQGKSWNDVSVDFIRLHPDALALLTEDGFRTFLPAWLSASLEVAEESLRENLIYTFSPKNDMNPDTTAFIVGRLQRLTPFQRETLAEVLDHIEKEEASSFLKKLARDAVVLIKNISSSDK